jgi:ankyrin repeat protein
LIERGTSINHQNSIGRTALLSAIHARDEGWKHKLISLLEPSVNIADNDGLTPLMRAARGAGLFGATRGNLQILKRLIEGRANVFAQDNRGLTALGHANLDARSRASGTNDEVVAFLEQAMVSAAAEMEFRRLYMHHFSSKGVLMLQHRPARSA